MTKNYTITELEKYRRIELVVDYVGTYVFYIVSPEDNWKVGQFHLSTITDGKLKACIKTFNNVDLPYRDSVENAFKYNGKYINYEIFYEDAKYATEAINDYLNDWRVEYKKFVKPTGLPSSMRGRNVKPMVNVKRMF